MLAFQPLQELFERAFHQENQKIRSSDPRKLYEPVVYSLKAGGKRIRPVLVLHAASLFAESVEPFLPAAFALEIFHNFTLLHDDIMDHAPIRRGEPAVHVCFGENSAILSGDAMSILAFQYLSQLETARLQPVLSLFSTTALQVCEGQQYDMEFETRSDVTLPEYLEMIRLKTAVLLACCLKTGALLAGADAHSADLLYDFGQAAGMAFQLQDDWLDVYGDEAHFGKKIGGDILENKKTYLLLTAQELGNQAEKTALLEWIGKQQYLPEEKIDAMRSLFTSTGAATATKNQMQSYVSEAMGYLDQLNVSEESKTELRDFAARVLSRAH
ncbi:MAG: polyprenyl synthetase family protein [Marinilabiliales bacterium]|nr:polyprenyl synthetase family protein [Marinilabiliales bacterium]